LLALVCEPIIISRVFYEDIKHGSGRTSAGSIADRAAVIALSPIPRKRHVGAVEFEFCMA